MMASLFLATALLLAWEMPSWPGPPPDAFLITVTSATRSPDTLRVPSSPPGACVAAPGSGPQTRCALWPGCPEDGVMTLSVQAVWPGGPGESANLVTCQFTALAPCECLPIAPVPPGQSPGPGGPAAVPSLPTTTLPLPLQPTLPTVAAPPPALVSQWTMPTHPAAT